ncbi:SDR family oxidoreductase [Streptomyces sp. A3M-1-3]|uniref:SDR family NAD(P)-dependent oxidoreductase n=1 Tax=Streptomyces sp. A3M-1-3 TaxID=2962044 RepID=UPI0020B7CF78|nr:SDR family oxidoreductase [Streptomyces sp. A3M-1-3]MCP3822085.1 SDR family oxidoreductase [Streptomyces sp. A3M-1-3]
MRQQQRPGADGGDSDLPPCVVVTGAGGQIGGATLEVLADRLPERWRLVSVDRKPDPHVPDGLRMRVHHHVVDLMDAAATEALFGDLADLFQVRHVMAIAGGADPRDGGPSGFDLPDPAVFRDSVGANLLMPYHVCHAAHGVMRHVPGDRSVTFCSSVNALGAWGRPAYSAAKAGLLALARTLAVATAPAGIRVNAVAPGSVLAYDGTLGREQDPAIVAELRRSIPLGKPATPDDVARAFAALALDLTHVTGQTLVVDGGQDARRRTPTV